MRSNASLILVWLAFGNPILFADDTLIEKVKTEAPKNWARYYQQLDLSSVNCQSTREYVLNGEQIVEAWSVVCIRQGPNVVWEGVFKKNGNVTSDVARVMNSRYDFVLHRNGDTWVVSEIDVFDDQPNSPPRILAGVSVAPLRAFVTWPLDIPLTLFNSASSEIVFDDAEQVDGGKVRVKLKFTSNTKFEVEDGATTARGAIYKTKVLTEADVILDPDNYWLPVQGDFVYGGVDPPASATVNWQYTTHRNLPVVSEYTEKVSREIGANEYHIFDIMYDSEPVTGDRFTMTHYGLPEPPGVRWGWPFWAKGMIAGLILIGVALAIRQFADRSQKK